MSPAATFKMFSSAHFLFEEMKTQTNVESAPSSSGSSALYSYALYIPSVSAIDSDLHRLTKYKKATEAFSDGSSMLLGCAQCYVVSLFCLTMVLGWYILFT